MSDIGAGFTYLIHLYKRQDHRRYFAVILYQYTSGRRSICSPTYPIIIHIILYHYLFFNGTLRTHLSYTQTQ